MHDQQADHVRRRKFLEGLALAATAGRGMPRKATLAHAAMVTTLVLTGGFAWLLPPLVFAQAAAMLLESSSYFPLRRRGPSAQPAPPWVAALFVAVNATLLGWVACSHPWPCLVVGGAGLVLAVGYRWLPAAESRRAGAE